MSIKFICKPEFFHNRLRSHLGLPSGSGCVEPGTTYFLCSDLTDVPALVSSQDPLSLTALSGGGKVQILICKDKSSEVKKSCQQPVTAAVSSPVLGTASTTTRKVGTQAVSSFTKLTNSENDDRTCVIDCTKPENICSVTSVLDRDAVKLEKNIYCSVTSTSDRDAVKLEDKKDLTTVPSSVQAPVVKVPLYSYNSVTSRLPTSNSVCPQELLVSVPSCSITPGTSAQTSTVIGSNLPCQSLRQELKQAILQRRKDEGKTMIDLVKEETDRQMALQKIKLSDDELEKRLKRRESNNKAGRKCREKRKVREESLRHELKRLSDHKNKLKELVSTLERQQKFLRMWACGVRKVDDEASREMIKSIMDSDIVVPVYPHRMEHFAEDDYTNSLFISSSEYNSDDTRNGFQLDSSQDTNDSIEDRTEVGYTEMTVGEIHGIDSENSSEMKEKDVGMFKEIKYECEDFKSDSDDDSDVELIEIDKPLVIDVD